MAYSESAYSGSFLGANNSTLTLELTDQATTETIYVMDIQGSMAISAFYSFHVTFLSTNLGWTAKQLLNTQVTLNFPTSSSTIAPVGTTAPTPQILGVITTFSIQDLLFSGANGSGMKDNYAIYSITISPAAQVLLNTPRTQVFVGQTIPDIIQTIYNSNTVNYATEFSLTTSTTPTSALLTKQHPFIFQFEETDANFVARLLEKAGLIYYFAFNNTSGSEQLIMTDSAMSTEFSPGNLPYNPYVAYPLTYQYFNAIATSAGSGALLGNTLGLFYQINITNTQVPATYSVFGDNYIYTKPPSGMSTQTPGSQSTTIFTNTNGISQVWDEAVTSDYIGNYAELLSNSTVWQSCIYSFNVYSSLVLPAYGLFLSFPSTYTDNFTQINGSPLYNGSSLYSLTVISVTYDISVGQTILSNLSTSTTYTTWTTAPKMNCAVKAIDGGLPYYSPLQTKAPPIMGFIPALVTGEQDIGTVQLDENGFYQISIPVNQAQTLQNLQGVGKAETNLSVNEGFFVPLTIGTTILLAFQNGNPDVPLIVGATPSDIQQSLVTGGNQNQSGILMSTKPPVAPSSLTPANPATPYTQTAYSYQTVGNSTWNPGSFSIVYSGQPGNETVAINYPDGSTYHVNPGQIKEYLNTDYDKLYAGNSATATLGNSAYDTYGNSTSTTYGDSVNTTSGDSTDETYGNSNSTMYGNSWNETHGVQTNISYDHSFNYSYGASTNITAGAETSVTIGPSNTLMVGEGSFIFLGINIMVNVGAVINANLAASYELKGGGTFGIHLVKVESHATASTLTSGVAHTEVAPLNTTTAGVHEVTAGVSNTVAGVTTIDAGVLDINAAEMSIDSALLTITAGFINIV